MHNFDHNKDAYLHLLLCLYDPESPVDSLINYVGSGEMAIYFPEVQEMVEFKTKLPSKNLWAHTLQVIKNTSTDSVLRTAALFHDIGKPATAKERDGEVTFHGHEIVGAKIWDRIACRCGVYEPARGKIRKLIRYHLKFAALAGAPGLTNNAIRRFLKEIGDDLDDLYALTIADITTAQVKKVKRNRERCEELRERIYKLIESDRVSAPKLPKGLGTRLYDTFGYKGPVLGGVMEGLTQRLRAGEIKETSDHGYYVRLVVDSIMKERKENEEA